MSTALAWTATPAKPAVTISYVPARVSNGVPILFLVKAPRSVRSVSGTWLGHTVAFGLDPAGKTWTALGGVSLDTKAGSYPFALSVETGKGVVEYRRNIKVLSRRYPRVILKVPGRYTAPSPEDEKQITADKELKSRLFPTETPKREWKGSFQAPVKALISDVFGVERVFNGSVQSTHQGLDFRVPTGTPVAAVSAGTVLLARPLFFEGNCVVIDHGQGLLTLYLHLAKFEVKEGEVVGKGQLIGLSGGTGRATGPHLHLAVRWQGIYLDPAGLLALPVR